MDRRPISRAEARAKTRDEIFEAAESLFLSAGYEATTVAQIAERAGRTQGSIYSNFAGKEALALEVIKHRYLGEFASLTVALHGAASFDEKLGIIAIWWEKLAGQQELTVFVAEYALAIRRTGTNLTAATEYVELLHDTVAAIVRQSLDREHQDLNDLVDRATKAVVATAVGLATGLAGGLVDSHESAQLLTEAIRLWTERVSRARDN